MSRINLSLSPEEEQILKPVYETGLHWISYVVPVLFLVPGIFAFLLFIMTPMISLFSIILFFLIYMGFRSLYAILLNRSTRIQIHSDRVTLSRGVFSRQIHDISNKRVEGSSLHQSFLGKQLGYGKIVLDTGGVAQSYQIKDPLRFREEFIKNLKENTYH